MSTLVLVVVTLAVVGVVTYLLMKKGTIADANNNNVPDAIEKKIEKVKVVVEKAKTAAAVVSKVVVKAKAPTTKKQTKK